MLSAFFCADDTFCMASNPWLAQQLDPPRGEASRWLNDKLFQHICGEGPSVAKPTVDKPYQPKQIPGGGYFWQTLCVRFSAWANRLWARRRTILEMFRPGYFSPVFFRM
jgi:hypothetical protein